jgi:O-succinylhomoserine sulfhydrylase
MSDFLKKKHMRTRLVHGGSRRSHYGEMSEAIFLTQGFVYKTAEDAERRFKNEDTEESFIYARYGNPTVAMFEERMTLLEGAEDAFATASGMAAVNAALFSLVRAGDHVVASRALFSSCLYILETLLPRFGVDVTLVDGKDIQAWEKAIGTRTKAVFLETPSNPTLEIIDIERVAEIAHSVGALLIVDNVFSMPIFQRPLELGADVVVYSTTKNIDGQGRCLGGVVLGTKQFVREIIEPYMRHTGAAMSPFNAWVMLKGLETLDLRCREQANSAGIVAQALRDSGRFESVTYPGFLDHPQHALIQKQMSGFGGIISFEVSSNQEQTFSLLNNLKIIKISNNLGDAKTIIVHPATTTHHRLDSQLKELLRITSGLLRLSVGLEHPQDIIDDVMQALG